MIARFKGGDLHKGDLAREKDRDSSDSEDKYRAKYCNYSKENLTKTFFLLLLIYVLIAIGCAIAIVQWYYSTVSCDLID